MSEIETLSTRVAYKNNWMSVREDAIRRQSGAEGIFGVVEKPDFVAIVPIQDGFIHLVEQYRYPVKQRFWEIPQGSWESDPPANPAVVAAGELKEETGLTAKKLSLVGHLFQAYGYSTQGFHVFLATDLHEGEQQLDSEEEGLVSRAFAISEFENMILSGEIKDATTIAAYGLIKLKNALPD